MAQVRFNHMELTVPRGELDDRMRADLTFDAAPARTDFGYAPRPFRPSADMFEAPLRDEA